MGGGRAYLFQTHLGGWGGLNRDRPGERERLIQFTKDGGIISRKRTTTQRGQAQVKEVGGHAAVQTKIRTSSWWKNHPGSIHTKLYRTPDSRDWSIVQAIIYEWIITGRGLEREGVALTLFYWKRGKGLIGERRPNTRLRQTISCWSPKWNNQTWSSARKPKTA